MDLPVHAKLQALDYLAPETVQALTALDVETLRGVLTAAQVSAEEGNAPGFGAAAREAGVRKQRALVKALAQPVKTRQGSADWGDLLQSLPEPEPESIAPEPAPAPAPRPPAALPQPATPLPDEPTDATSLEAVEATTEDSPLARASTHAHTRTHAHARARAHEEQQPSRRASLGEGRRGPAQGGYDDDDDEDNEGVDREAVREEDASSALYDMIVDERLTAQQAQGAIHLAMGLSFSEAARRLGCCRRTLSRWREQDDFQEAIARVGNYLARRLLDDIHGAQRLALDTLIGGLDAMKPSIGGAMVPDWQARQRCADSILDRGGKLLKGEMLQVTQQVTHSMDEDYARKLAELELEMQRVEAEQIAIDVEFASLVVMDGGHKGGEAA